MRQRIRMRAIRVIVLLFAVITVSCDQATDLTAPSDADAVYALNDRKLEQILGGLDGNASASKSVDWGSGGVAALEVNGFTHFLVIDDKAVRQPTEFTMAVGSMTVSNHEIRFIDLKATSVGSSEENDVGRIGFRPRNVVLCMDVASVGLSNPFAVDIYHITERSIARMPRVSKPSTVAAGSTTYTCASLPHFSGFVMGAN